MSENMAVVRYIEAPLTERHQYAQALASAGDLIPRALFGPPENGKPPQPSVGKVLLVLETGAMLGIHPVAALAGINVIEGKPAASSGLISGVLRAAGHKVRIASTGTIEGGDFAAVVTLIRHDDPDAPFVSTWTPHRAARAGLCKYAQGANGVWKVEARSKQGQALPWENYTESLCKARAISEVGRDGGQDALMGVRYTPEELGANVDAAGEYVPENVGELVPERAAQSAKPAARKQATNGTQGTRKAKVAEPAPEPTPEPDPEPAAALVPDEPAAEAHAATAEPAPVRIETAPAELSTGETAQQAELSAYIAEKVAARKAREAAAAVPVADANVIDAEVVEDDEAEKLERAQREWEAAEQMRMVAEADAADEEAARLAALSDEVGAGIAAEDAEFDASRDESWFTKLERAATVADCAAIWNGADNARELDSDLRIAIVKHKDALIAAAA